MSASRAPRHADTHRIGGWAAAWPNLRHASSSSTERSLTSSSDELASSLMHGSAASAVYNSSASSSPFAVPMSMANADSPPTTPPDSSNLRLLPSVHAVGATTLESNTASPSSRNDIFSVAKPQPMPAPRLAVSIGSNSSSTTGSSPSSSSKNSLFFGSSSSPMASVRSPIASSPTPATAAKLSLPSAAHATARPHSNSLDRPSYGRSSTEERERERARIRQSRDQVDFRLCPTKDFLLGEGRHCNVYLGSYRLKPRSRKQRQTQSSSSSSSEDTTAALDQVEEEANSLPSGKAAWQLCAIKRLHADRQSQLLGLDEAFALRRLGPHPHVVSLIDIRDEVQLTTTSPLPGAPGGVWAGVASDAATLGMGVPSSLAPPPHTGSSHARSTSETHSRAQLGLQSRSPERRSDSESLHRRLASQPMGDKGLPNARSYDNMPVVRIAAPDDEGDGSTLPRSRTPSPAGSALPTPVASPTPSASSSSSNDPPRLLILLELLPHSLSTFAKRNPERVDWPTWRTWAFQMAETIEWMHGKGCVHADIKKENILLTDSLDVKLCDFNSAVFPSANAPLLDGAGLGTPAYGAPELTRTPGASPGFSFPCDVWSCGAVLYSLATGVEPFERARSMIDMLYRKRIFFESEENDRIARLSVAEGYGGGGGSNTGSACASRNGSLRGRNARAARPIMRREASIDSIESVASSIRVAGGNASLRDIAMLLDAAPPTGLLLAPGQREGEAGDASHHALTLHGHQRAASLGKSSHLNLSRSTQPTTIPSATLGGTYTPAGTSSARLGTPGRPATLRRTTSYGGDLNDDESSGVQSQAPTPASPPASYLLNAPASPRSPRASNAGLRLAVSAALAQASRRAAQTQTHESSPFDSPLSANARLLHRTSDAGDYAASLDFASPLGDDEQEEEMDLRPYRDGSPALVLPGGGRLPDAARALLEKMLSTDPSLRPTAGQVVAALRNL